MPVRTPKTSPRVKARLAGALYLISGLPAGFAVFLFRGLVVPNDPAGTAANILGSEFLFRLGFVADILSVTLVIAVTILLYDLFKPVGRNMALLATVLGLIGNSIQALNSFNNLAALLLLERAGGSTAFTAAQTQELAYVFLQLHSLVFDIALVFFGISWVLFAYLVLRSTFLPRLISVPLAADGVGYLAFSLAVFLAPPVAALLYPIIPFVTAFVGEGALMLWFIVKGVDVPRWTELATPSVERGDS